MLDFTVFTPTYNRSHTLERVYQSLCQQTCRNFEWLIIDDGSEDDTQSKIKKWIEEASFVIQYFYQSNQGKHIAFNEGVQKARGKFFVPLDSDDACEPNALMRLLELWNDIDEKEKEYFSGVCVHCKDQFNNLIGDLFPSDKMDSTSCEMLYRYSLKGEKWGFHRTDILRQYPFPKIQDVFFMPESIIWHAIAKKYKMRFSNEKLRIYYHDKAERSLTSELSTLPALRARLLYYYWVLENDLDWFWERPNFFLKYIFQYIRFSVVLREKRSFFRLKHGLSKILFICIYLPASLLGLVERKYIYAKKN